MNRAERRRNERLMRNEPRKQTFMNIPDLGEIKARNEAKAATPPWEAGEPVFSMPVGVPLSDRGISFTDVIERVATNLGIDGWKIVGVKSVQALGAENTPEGPVAGFQVAVQVAQVEKLEPKSDDADI